MASPSLQRIALVGAGGNSGSYILQALLATGKHQVTAITREDSKSKIDSAANLSIAKVNYDDEASLAAALKDQEALVITMSVNAPSEASSKLIQAAARAGVKWILPNEYGSQTDAQASRDTLIGYGKQKTRKEIEDLGLNWIALVTSFWYEWSLCGGAERFGFDMEKRTADFWDEGTRKINVSTWPQVGRSVAALLSLPVGPEEGKTTLSTFKNDFVYASSFQVSQRDMLDSLQRVTATAEEDWTVTKRPAKEAHAEGMKLLKSGQAQKGFALQLYSRYFFDDDAGNTTKLYRDDNEKLGLKREDVDAASKASYDLLHNGFFDTWSYQGK